MSWNDNNPWGSGNGNNPWGSGPSNKDFENTIRKAKSTKALIKYLSWAIGKTAWSAE